MKTLRDTGSRMRDAGYGMPQEFLTQRREGKLKAQSLRSASASSAALCAFAFNSFSGFKKTNGENLRGVSGNACRAGGAALLPEALICRRPAPAGRWTNTAGRFLEKTAVCAQNYFVQLPQIGTRKSAIGNIWRSHFAVLFLLCLALPSRAGLTDRLGGAFRGAPEDALSPAASALVARAFADIGPAPLEDYHAHLVGLGVGATHAEINPAMQSWWHPARRFKAHVFLSATGVEGTEHFDGDYVARLVRLARGFGHPVRIHLLAMDHSYLPDGTLAPDQSDFYVPNEYVMAVARRYPDLFVPVISVHPDRPDALAELARWAGQGVRCVKWLPNAQGIDPAQPRYDAFYRQLRKLDLVLLTHTGAEGAVDAAGAQELGNPLRLRRALDAGVKVIMAHCASRGQSDDLDQPGTRADSFDLFLRMMDDPRYRGLLFADISALTQWNRLPRPLLEVLRRPDLQARLVNGSDYPMPALNCVISLRKLETLGLIASADRQPLAEIYEHNPLLFDFVLKRALREPATGARLPAKMFLENPLLSGLPAAAKTAAKLPVAKKEQGT